MSADADRALWARLGGAGLAHGEMPAQHEAQAPWYVRVMLGIAGLVAALFLLAFLGAGFQLIIDSATADAIVGTLLIGGAYLLFRGSSRGDFAPMFALAVSIAGQALVIYGVAHAFNGSSIGAPATFAALLETGLALAMPNYIHRVGSAYAASVAFSLALGSASAGILAPAAIIALFAWLWLNEARLARAHSRVTPIAYGLTLGFIQVEATALFGRGALLDMPVDRPLLRALAPAGEALVALVFVAVVATLIRRAGWSLRGSRAVAALLGATAVGAASLQAPGISGGLAIVLLGFAGGNAVLCGLGVAGLLFYLSGYYYLLDLTLLGKAITLAATGIVLLAARQLLLKHAFPNDRPNP